jgi:anion-transporting  ArsA/GET3 family ATPase
MAEFITELNDLFGGFKQRAKPMVEAALRAPEVSFVLVTSPAPMSIQEVLFFSERLEEAAMPRGAFVVNRFRSGRRAPPGCRRSLTDGARRGAGRRGARSDARRRRGARMSSRTATPSASPRSTRCTCAIARRSAERPRSCASPSLRATSTISEPRAISETLMTRRGLDSLRPPPDLPPVSLGLVAPRGAQLFRGAAFAL